MTRICVVRQYYVPDDIRVRREIDALASAGHEVTVLCMRPPGAAARERHPSADIRRLPMHHKRGGIARYLFEYVAFPLLATLYLTALHVRHRFDLVQVNTVPDWLVFAALVPRLTGTPVLLDLQEIMPEFFASKYRTTLEHRGVRLLAALEQASIRFSSFAITCTEQMREAFLMRGADPERMRVVMNSADETIFDAERQPPHPRYNGHFGLISHGTIEERYGLDTMIEAVARLRDRIPGLRLDIYGAGSYADELEELVRSLALSDRVAFHGFVPMDELVAALARADAGIVAMKRDIFRDLTQCNKMFDLITMGKPVICSRTTSTMEHFSPRALEYFDADDAADLARAIEALYTDSRRAERLVDAARKENEPYRWPHQRAIYLDVVERLLRDSAARGAGRAKLA